MLHLFESPAGRTQHEIVKETMDLMCAAEDLGFDSVHPAEHHFSEYGLLGSPQVSLAAIAARTKRIRLGSGVVVLPFHNPIRVAEDFAMLDLISDGRVDLGLGRGYQPAEFAGFGLDPTKSREMFNEGAALIKKCWTEEHVTFKGEFYQADGITVNPKPIQKPHPPIYMACASPESFDYAGEQGFDVFMSSAFGLDSSHASKGMERYKKARDKAGLDTEAGKVSNLVMIYVADSMEQARADFEGPVNTFYQNAKKFVAPPEKAPVKGYESYKDTNMGRGVDFDELERSGVLVCGDVEHAVERLCQMSRQYGFSELLCWSRMGGLETKKVQRAMELISGKVIPAVKKELGG